MSNRMLFRKLFPVLLNVLIVVSCNSGDRNIGAAVDSITADDLKEDISVLASDDFLGRLPGTEGEVKTVGYLAGQFKALGLEPAVNGSYFQEVPLMEITPVLPVTISVEGGKKPVELKYSDDIIVNTSKVTDEVKTDNSEIVFVGYGINAPENDWNDFEGLDVKGKTLLILVNDPGYATGDTTLFTGKAMTYYGRWTYKYEEAARQGAAGAIIIHETGAAAYPWGVVQNSFTGPQFYLQDDEISKSDLLVKGWITTEAAGRLFESAGLDYGTVIKSASGRGFRPMSLNLGLNVAFRNTAKPGRSSNVAALLPGTRRADEYIIYTSHWDHFGVNPEFEGDSILNGAVDNATGTAALLEIAEAFKTLNPAQDRSVLFLAVTCEEQGLLGSSYYAKNPLFPLASTVAVINMDALNIIGKTNDMTILGSGFSELDSYAVNVLEKHGRYANPDPEPERGSYFRSDHFSFARAGVPSLYLSEGMDDAIHGRDWKLERKREWVLENYHKPSDNYEPGKWSFEGMTADVKVFFEIGYDLSISSDFPEWNPGIQFKSLRDEMMKSAK